MNVEELIAKLQHADPKAKVVMAVGGDADGYTSVEAIEIVKLAINGTSTESRGWNGPHCDAEDRPDLPSEDCVELL